MSTVGEGPPGAAAAIEALRARGASRLAPVRWRQLEALARRAAAHQGRTRQLLDDRLAQLLAACAKDLERRGGDAAEAVPPPPRHETLGGLLAHIASQTLDPVAPQPAGRGVGDGKPAAELKAVRDHRDTWSRLSADRRLMQALAQVPGQAGPLNTQRLLHQAMTVMRDASPGYLHHFLSHVEALLWLDQARWPSAASTAPEPRRRRHARPGRQQ
jgi:hypothetical protein